MEEMIKGHLINQSMFGDAMSAGELALQLMFTDWCKSAVDYEGKDEDKAKILSNCKSIEDAYSFLKDNISTWNFENTGLWTTLYGKREE